MSRAATTDAAYDVLDRMQGLLQEVRALLFDLPDVADAARAVARIEPLIEDAKVEVLEAGERRG